MVEFSQELFDRICERMAQGETLRKICLEKDMPNITTVWKWKEAGDERGKQYAHAREAQADAQFERIGDVVDKVEDGTLEPQQARAMVDALKWTAGKLRPKVYGDKVDVSGNVGFTVTIAGDDADL
jgi:hypothetical protein